MRDVLLLDERILADGRVARTWGEADGETFRLRDDDGTAGQLSLVALDRVMTRYGRALDPEIPLDGEALTVGGHRLRRLRYHAVVDAEARDYLVWERPGAEPLAGIATMITAALRYLVLRLGAARPSDS